MRRRIATGCSELMPSTTKRPADGRRIVVRIRIEVVLPAPLGPRNPRTLPAFSEKVRPFRATLSP